jgi:hypothetical protein
VPSSRTRHARCGGDAVLSEWPRPGNLIRMVLESARLHFFRPRRRQSGCATGSGTAAQQCRRNNVDTWSALDITPGEDWTQAIDKKSAGADGYIFLVGAGASENPRLRAEWRSLLRNAKRSCVFRTLNLEVMQVNAVPSMMVRRDVSGVRLAAA